MSCGPVTVPIRRQPRATRRSTASRAPPALSTSTNGVASLVSQGRPMNTRGRSIRPSASTTPSSRWCETTTAPSVCPPRRYRTIRSASSSRWRISSTICSSAGTSARATPCSVPAKNGSEKTIELDSGDHDGDRVGAAGDQAAGGPVRCVPEPADGLVDRLLRLGADPQAAVDRPRHRGAREARQGRDLLERRRTRPRSRAARGHPQPGTTLTSLGARTMTVRIVAAVQGRPPRRTASASSRSSSSPIVGGHLQPVAHLALRPARRRSRSPRPAATRRPSASRPGRRTGSWPSRAHMSSAVYGANSDSSTATASTASRTAGSAPPDAGVDRLAGGVDQLHHAAPRRR